MIVVKVVRYSLLISFYIGYWQNQAAHYPEHGVWRPGGGFLHINKRHT